MQSRLQNAESTISTLQASNTQLTSLITDYENALTLLLDKLRPYAYTQTSSIIALHKHYQILLENERATSMQLRLEHTEWQAGLGRVAEYARQALKVQTLGEEGLVSEVRGLKEENRVLRRLAGWEEREGSSDEEEEKKPYVPKPEEDPTAFAKPKKRPMTKDGKLKQKKRNFRYETKTERKMTREKQKKRNHKEATARREANEAKEKTAKSRKGKK